MSEPTNEINAFELAQRQGKMYAASDLVPKQFQNSIGNCVIALEMAQRIGASPMAVMQNLYIVNGRPSWSSSFIIAAINQSGRYSPLRFEMSGEGDTRQCIAWANEKADNTRLESPPVSIQLAKDEGWYQKNGSKWKTMPELMLRYRSATLFGRLYAPEILMGMHSEHEAEDAGERRVEGREIPRAQVAKASPPRLGPPPAAEETPDEAPPGETEEALLLQIDDLASENDLSAKQIDEKLLALDLPRLADSTATELDRVIKGFATLVGA